MVAKEQSKVLYRNNPEDKYVKEEDSGMDSKVSQDISLNANLSKECKNMKNKGEPRRKNIRNSQLYPSIYPMTTIPTNDTNSISMLNDNSEQRRTN